MSTPIVAQRLKDLLALERTPTDAEFCEMAAIIGMLQNSPARGA